MTVEELRKLDVEIHQKVMKRECFENAGEWWETFAWMTDLDGKPMPCRIPAYSTDIGDAWQVVEEMAKRTEGFELIDWPEDGELRWLAYFGNQLGRGEPRAEVEAATAPLAICLAARAVAHGVANGQA